MQFENLLHQLESHTDAEAIMLHDHEALKDQIKELVPLVNQMSSFAMSNGNVFASRKYSALASDLLKALAELESTRV